MGFKKKHAHVVFLNIDSTRFWQQHMQCKCIPTAPVSLKTDTWASSYEDFNFLRLTLFEREILDFYVFIFVSAFPSWPSETTDFFESIPTAPVLLKTDTWASSYEDFKPLCLASFLKKWSISTFQFSRRLVTCTSWPSETIDLAESIPTASVCAHKIVSWVAKSESQQNGGPEGGGPKSRCPISTNII